MMATPDLNSLTVKEFLEGPCNNDPYQIVVMASIYSFDDGYVGDKTPTNVEPTTYNTDHITFGLNESD